MALSTNDIETALSNVMDPELNISIVDLGLIYEIHVDASTGYDIAGNPTPATDRPQPASSEGASGTPPHTFQPGKIVHIVMTLTTLGCPLFNVIEADIKKNIAALGVPEEQIDLELVFDPPWSMDRMSESAKAMLGI
jgi:metal-sulfur cluster biosynthetic enzyme